MRLYSINHKSGLIKSRLTAELARKNQSSATFPDDLIKFVLAYVQPFYSKNDYDALEREMNLLARKEDLSAMSRLAIDSTGISAVEEWAAS